MVDFIKRDKNDIFSRPILGFLFKNQKFLFVLRVTVTVLFFYALFLGFIDRSKNNLFTPALFWGIFWSLFMVTTLPTFGRIFCGICPHGFMGKYITKIGLKKRVPKWMQNRFIGLGLLVLGWWGVYYIFPGVYRTPVGTALLFSIMTLLSFALYFIYKDMSYCKYICPIGTVTRAFSKLSFTWLGSYKSACSECRTFDCAKACPYSLKPFTFDKKNSMEDCTLCMECTNACESISFKFKKPSSSLFKKFKILKAEVWAYLLILASIPIAMAFHHGIGRSNAAKEMIWSKTAEIFKPYLPHSMDTVGLFAFLYAVVFTILSAAIGMYIASKILKKPFGEIFYSLGYSYAPLFIFASLGHALSGFFTRGYERIIEGFAWAFGIGVNVEPLAKRGDDWLMIFSGFKWLAIAWALFILYKRVKLIEATTIRKIISFPFAASLILFYFGVNQYRSYIVQKYGRVHSPSHRSMSHSAFYKNRRGDKKTSATVYVKPSDTLFFTDRNPMKKSGRYMMGMRRNSSEAVPKRSFWLVTKSLKKPKCVKNINGTFFALDRDGNKIETKISKKNGCAKVTIEVPKNGYYNIYYLQNQRNIYNIAKYEYKRFDHGSSEKFSKEKIAPRVLKSLKFDILRLRDNENSFYYRLHIGDSVRFKVLFNNKPIAGAKVIFKTQFGWQKSLKTDDDGIVNFKIIQDYLPDDAKKFNKRFREKFLIVANYKAGNKLFKISYTDIFMPSRDFYQSYKFALMIFILLLVITTIGVFYYRYKVKKPFKEVNFDE